MKKNLLLFTLFLTLFAFSAISPTYGQTDTDNDGVADVDDLDDDNDGVADLIEYDPVFMDLSSFTVTGTNPNFNVSGIALDKGITMTAVSSGNPVVANTSVASQTINYSFPAFTPPNEGVQDAIRWTVDIDNNTSRSFTVTYTLSEPVKELYLNLSNIDYTQVTFTGTQHRETLYSGAPETEYNSATRTFRDTDGNTVSDPTRDAYGTLRIEPATPGGTFDTIVVEYTDSPTTSSPTQDGNRWTFFTMADTDNDGIPDYLDLDSDNDGIADIIEAGGVDSNNDGLVDNSTDTDGDGLANDYDSDNGGTELTDINTDGDSTPNRIDLDSDNDDCSDANEYYNRPGADGGDGDGVFGPGTPSVDTEGLVTAAGYDGTSLANVTDNSTSSACTLSLTGGDCWRTLSPSNSGYTYESFFASFTGGSGGGTNGLWTQGIAGSRGTDFGVPNVYTMDPTGTAWEPVSNLGANLDPGMGVLISVFSDNDYDGTDDGFPKESDLFTLSNQDEPQTPRPFTIATNSGFNMVGNPFNSAIDFGAIGRTNVSAEAWVYDRTAPNNVLNNPGNSGWWRSTNDSGIGDLGNGIIAAGQGFVVQGTGAGSLSLAENDKSTQENPDFYGKQADRQLPDHLRLEVRGPSVYNSAWVQFSSEGSPKESVNGDVQQFYPFESEYAVLSTLKEGQLMDIGHFPTPTSGDDLRIPLTVETTSTGPMTLELTDLQLAGTTLYLHDTETGESVELTEGATYTFTPSGTPAKALGDCYSAPTGFLGPQKAKDSGPRFYISAEASLNSGGPEVPSEYGLDQNYPNPFNPTTQITYQLPRQADVRLEVFDMAGRQVATLVNQAVTAGTHTVNFNATNLSSGVYMYRLQAGSAIITKKLTLIK